MQVTMATLAAGPGGANEDFAGAVPTAAVMLDGAGIPGTETICHHGVAWYAHHLGGELLGRLSRDVGRDLTAILGDAIEQITDEHRDSCDVTNPSSPQATVAMFRVIEDRADYLVLADAVLVLNPVDTTPLVVRDPREVAIRRSVGAEMDSVEPGTPAYEAAKDQAIEAIPAQRNRPGGYWIAKDDPRAAAEALTGSHAVGDLAGAALLSNGASRIVDRFGLSDWTEVFATLDAAGPFGVIRRVRAAEASAGISPDDATIAYCTRLPDAG
jgi:hypothetical protein